MEARRPRNAQDGSGEGRHGAISYLVFITIIAASACRPAHLQPTRRPAQSSLSAAVAAPLSARALLGGRTRQSARACCSLRSHPPTVGPGTGPPHVHLKRQPTTPNTLVSAGPRLAGFRHTSRTLLGLSDIHFLLPAALVLVQGSVPPATDWSSFISDEEQIPPASCCATSYS